MRRFVPIHIVLVKLHRLQIFQLWVGKEFALDIFPLCHLHNGFRTHALVDMQCHRIDSERFRLLFARPFEPWAMVFQCFCKDLYLIGGEWPPLCFLEQFRELVGVAVFVESQTRRQVGVVGVYLLRFFLDSSM